MAMDHTADQILSILDRCCDAFCFPMLDNGYVYPAATRLSLFRSTADWGMVIEVFGYSPRAGLPDTHVYTFANRIHDRPTRTHFVSQEAWQMYLANNPNNCQSSVFPIASGLWIDPDQTEQVAKTADHIVLRGRRIDLPSSAEYARAGVQRADPDHLYVYELCRALADVARNDVLATPEERRKHVGSELELLLVLDEWEHPNVVDDKSRPSGSQTFQELASVLVSGDAGAYHPSPNPNTHWSHWPVGGTL
jgi:hypothetical protein